MQSPLWSCGIEPDHVGIGSSFVNVTFSDLREPAVHKILCAVQTTEVGIERLGMCLVLAVLMGAELSTGDISRCVLSPEEEIWMERP